MKALMKGTPWYVHASMLVSFSLVVAGFCVPPMGIVDGSVLTSVGELLGGATLLTFVVNIPVYLEVGIKARIARGNTEVSIQSTNQKQHHEENNKDVTRCD